MIPSINRGKTSVETNRVKEHGLRDADTHGSVKIRNPCYILTIAENRKTLLPGKLWP